MYKKVCKAMKNPKLVLARLMNHKLFNDYPDDKFLQLKYKLRMGMELNLQTPKTFNEKLQWLKLYDRNPQYTRMVDKYEVREYVAETIGEAYLIPLLGVWNNFEDIDFTKLPNQFVLKCTHDSGGLIICKDKGTLDVQKAKKKINKCLKRNFHYSGREWPYKNVKPRIICEKYMVDESGTQLKDYKFLCFNGTPKMLFVATDRGIDTRFDFFDMKFKHLSIMQHYKNGIKKIIKPQGFDLMVELAQKLSRGIPHIRVDFYDINGCVFFGELTFFHFSGFERFEPEHYDELLGSWIELPNNIIKS